MFVHLCACVCLCHVAAHEQSVSLSCCVCVMRGWPRVGCCYLANIVRQPIHPWTTTNAEFSLVSSDISTDSGNTVFEQICFFPRTMWNFRIQFLVTVNRFEMFFWLDKSVWLYRMYKMCWKFLCVLPTFVTISRLARISSQMIFLRRLSRFP